MQLHDSIKLFCTKYGISFSELARRLNKSPQSFSQKVKRGTLSLDDLEEIAVVTGCQLDCSLIMPTGDKVKINF